MRALDRDHINGLILGDAGRLQVIGDDQLPGAWVLDNLTVTTTGQEFTGPADPVQCAERGGPGSCIDWVSSLGLRQDITYHPAEQFWTLQFIETGVFLGLALLLAGFCFWWVRRRSV